MELIVLIVLLVLLDLAAVRWGTDSRDTARGYFGTGEIVTTANRGGAA